VNICWNDILLRDKALEIKLKVIELKYKNIKIIKIMEYDVEISPVMFRVYSVVCIIVRSHVVARLKMDVITLKIVL
jgi:hypothetical protein